MAANFGNNFVGKKFTKKIHFSKPSGNFLHVGESTVIFNSFESQPSSDPGGWGNYILAPTITSASNGDLLAIYYRGATHSHNVSSHRIIKSFNKGRSWQQIGEENTILISGENTYNEAVRGPHAERFSTGRIGLVFNTLDLDDITVPVRTTYYRFSDTDGTTWSTTSSIPNTGSNVAAGKSLVELGNGTLLLPAYWRLNTETRYTSNIYSSPNTSGSSGSWSQRSVIAQDASPGGRQFEAPVCHFLNDGRVMCLIREDITCFTYRVYSSDQGLTWDTPTPIFATKENPAWVQCQNGTLVAQANRPADKRPELYYSKDSGLSWEGPVVYCPDNPDGGTQELEGGGIIEISPNLIGVVSAQTRTSNASSRLLFTEVGVGINPPSRFRNSYVISYPVATGNALNYGTASYLNGASAMTLEAWYRRESGAGGSQCIISRAGTNNLQYRLQINTSNQVVISIASNLTTLASYTTNLVLQEDFTYHIVTRFSGSDTGNSGKLRIWINNQEDVSGSYTGTVPSTMTSPDSSATETQVGSDRGSNFLRSVYLSFVRCWSAAIPTASVGTLYNQRAPISLSDANTAVGSSAIFSMRYNGDTTDEVGFLPIPIVTGSISFSQRCVP